MRTWILNEKVDTIGLEEGSILAPKYPNYPFDYQKCKETYQNASANAKESGIKQADLALALLVGILLIV